MPEATKSMSIRSSGLAQLSQASVKYGHQLLWVVLARTLRGSLLTGGALLVISATGSWQFFASSFAAHDLKRAAAHAPAEAATDVVMVAIDDTGFRDYFGGHSPLDKSRFMALARTIEQAVPQAEAIVVDLDLSPAPDEEGDTLPGFFSGLKPNRWIIARPDTLPGTADEDWYEAMCQAGVRSAHPHVPTAFGYAAGTHQFTGSLSQAVGQPATDCHAEAAPADRVRIAAPLSASYLKEGVVLPFQGDLEMLRLTLASLQPRQVVLGGTWGREDIIGTPLGERFGMHLHAAAMEGQLRGARLAPFAVQLAWAWLVLSVISLAVGHVQHRLSSNVLPWADRHPGHRLLAHHLWPLAVTLGTITCLLLVSEAAAVLNARTGFWLPTSTVAAVTLSALIFAWNWGRTQVARYDSVTDTWYHAVVEPVVAELRSAAAAWHVCMGASSMGELDMSRPRAAAEGVLALLSLVVQTAMPIVSLYFVLTRPI